jgi:hypothetical protein
VRWILKLFSKLTLGKDKERMKFRPGDRVRILPYERIAETLDERKCYDSLLFMEGMAEFCGGDYEVLREVKWLYDEESEKMLRCKDIVVLKGLVCEGKGVLDGKNCDRSCLYFWKTAWLKKG